MSFMSFSQRTDSFGPVTRSHSRNINTSEASHHRSAEDHYWSAQDSRSAEGLQFSTHARNDNHATLQGSRRTENRTVVPVESIATISASRYAHIIHHASRNDLLEHKNGAYLQVFDAYTRVKAERDSIKKMHENLTAAVGLSLQNAANPPSGFSDTSGPLAPMSISNKENMLLETDYPAIKYWKKKMYTKAMDAKKNDGSLLKVNEGKPLRGKTRLAETGENVAMDYIETPDGKSIDGITASSIRTYLRSLFIELNNAALKGGIPMPTSWGTSCASMRDGVLLRLYAKYPYVRYCQDDWKADYLLSRSYSTWRSGEKKKADKIKVEPIKTEDVKPFDGATSAGRAVAKRDRSPGTSDAGDDIYCPSPPKKSRIEMATPPHQAPNFPTSNVMPPPPTSTSTAPTSVGSPVASSPAKPAVVRKTRAGTNRKARTSASASPIHNVSMDEPSSGARTNSQAPTTSPTSIPVTSRPARAPAARKTRAGASRIARTAPASTTSPTPDPAASSHETGPAPQKTCIGTEDVAHTAPACVDQAPADASIDSQASVVTDPAASTLAELPVTRATRSGNDIEASQAVNTAPLAADGDNMTSAAPAAAISTLTKPAIVAVAKLAPIINPLDMLFGPPTGPSTRLDALMSEKATAPGPTAITGSTASATLNTTPKDGPAVGMKRVTASTSAKNLCYIAYLEDHEPISCAAFEDYYKKLPKDEIKNWNSKSRLAKLTPA